MLLHSTRLPPLINPDQAPSPFRMPDHPFSLFEGLAGAVCAWLDACIIIRDYLAGKDTTSVAEETKVLGIPGLGGLGAHGLL
jgi:hypothetical protein